MAENIESFYEKCFCDIRGVAEIIEVLFGGRPRREGMVFGEPRTFDMDFGKKQERAL